MGEDIAPRRVNRRTADATLALVTAFALALTACGESANTSAMPPSRQNERIELKVQAIADCQSEDLVLSKIKLYRSIGGDHWSLIGMIENRGNTSVNYAAICAQVVTRSGEVLEATRTYLPVSLQASERLPFRVHISGAEQAAEVHVSAHSGDAEIAASGKGTVFTVRAVHRQFTITQWAAYGGNKLDITLRNEGKGTADSVRLVVGAFNKEGDLIGVYEARFDDLDVIKPGELRKISATTDLNISREVEDIYSVVEGYPRRE